MEKWKVDADPVALHPNPSERIQRMGNEYYGVTISMLKVPAKRYVTAKGTKITKLLNKRLREAGVEKDKLEKNWAGFCKSVRGLYAPETSFIASYANESLLGHGTYEDYGTCYREGSNNFRSQFGIKIWNRARMLTIEKVRNEADVRKALEYKPKRGVRCPRPCARCIMVDLGKRHILLTNFYYTNGIPHNHHQFVQALEAKLKTNFTKVSNYNLSGDLFPMSKNQDAYLITDAKGKELIKASGRTSFVKGFLPKHFSYACPSCHGKILREKLWWEQNGATYYFGCSSTHGKAKPNKLPNCPGCAGILAPGEGHVVNGHGPYCDACYGAGENCWDCGNLCIDSGTGFIRDWNDNVICLPCYQNYKAQNRQCVICDVIQPHITNPDYHNVAEIFNVLPYRAKERININICKAPACMDQLPMCECGEINREAIGDNIQKARHANIGAFWYWHAPYYRRPPVHTCGTCFAKFGLDRALLIYDEAPNNIIADLEKAGIGDTNRLREVINPSPLLQKNFTHEGARYLKAALMDIREELVCLT